MMVEQSPTSRQLVVNYSELVVDQSPTSHRLICRSVAERLPTNCKRIAERAATDRRLIGNWSATIPVVEKWLQCCRGRKQKSVAVRSSRGRKLCGTGALDNSTKTFAALNNSTKNNDAYKCHL